MQKLDSERNCTLELMVYSSFSPCVCCCDMLVDFAKWLDSKSVRLNATLKFSNFNDIDDAENPEASNNMWEKLKSLFAYFTLKTFDGQSDWEEFLNNIEVAPEDKINCLAYALSKDRNIREKHDLSILLKIEENSDFKGIKMKKDDIKNTIF